MPAVHSLKKSGFREGIAFHSLIGCHGLPYLVASLQSRCGIVKYWKRDF
jgi:hypothetical protein